MKTSTSQPSAAVPARNADLRVVLVSLVTGSEQWRGQFSEWARDNDELTPAEMEETADKLVAHGRCVLNMGAGGAFELRVLHRIELWLEDGGWMSSDTDPRVRAVFGTDTLPTPFLEGAPASMVVDVIQRVNPLKEVVLREGGAS